MNTDLIAYYRDRAKEYEKIYFKPERQEDLQTATKILQSIFQNKSVLEIACGTGYWTERIAVTANSIFATDINDTVIELAGQKNYPRGNVTFQLADFNNLENSGRYESLFGGFILSHIKWQDMDSFLDTIGSLVPANGTIVLMDNNFVDGSSYPITYRDEQGNTYQTRKLDDGTNHLVLKNFPTEKFLKNKLDEVASDIKFVNLKYYWILTYTNKQKGSR